MGRSAYLLLENGKKFKGKMFGTHESVTGEVVFTTTMTGYMEALTDPTYYGQIVVGTFPSFGNCGVITSDFESPGSHLKAYIVKEWCHKPSNFRCESAIDAFFVEHGIVGLYGVDTRGLTKELRESGTMNGRIVLDDNFDIADIKNYKIENAVKSVTCSETAVIKTEEASKTVVVYDFGVKNSHIDALTVRSCTVIKVPAATTAGQVMQLKPDGVILSGGPGDPTDNAAVIDEITTLCENKIPTFGIGLGHQILALANGAQTDKLRCGHRGSNIPVRDLQSKLITITKQNHSYVVDIETLGDFADISHENVYDGTCEGIKYRNIPAFSVQFNPTDEIFDKFIDLMMEDR